MEEYFEYVKNRDELKQKKIAILLELSKNEEQTKKEEDNIHFWAELKFTSDVRSEIINAAEYKKLPAATLSGLKILDTNWETGKFTNSDISALVNYRIQLFEEGKQNGISTLKVNILKKIGSSIWGGIKK